MRKKILMISGLGFVLGCGGSSSPTITVNFINGTGISACTVGSPTCSDPFKDPSVVDVIFLVNNQAVSADVTDSSGKVLIANGTILDTNQDSNPDSLAYPTTCGVSVPSSCGFLPSATNFNLEGVPLNYRYTITVRFRNSAGTALYEGISSSFDNIASITSSISITINKIGA